MNKQIFISTLLTVLMSMTGVKGLAHDIEVKNADGVTIYYDWIHNNTELAVSFRGEHSDDYSNEYTGNVVIPKSVDYNGKNFPVTSIGGFAFYECSGLTSVTIHNSIISIGYEAFAYCSGLTSVTIPNSVTSIGDYAFYGCSGLTSVTIPKSITSIGEYTFGHCTGLTSVTIPNSVTSIGDGAFFECSGLTSVTIPNSVTSIGSFAFDYCSGLTSVTIPNSVTSIGNSAFNYCRGLTSVTIPNSVTSIGSYAFYYCSGLTSVTIGNSVTSIGKETFYCCSGLTSVTIPNSVTSIGESAFSGCSDLTSVTIGSGVRNIYSHAFTSCSKLTDVYCSAEKITFTDENVFNYTNIKYATLHVPRSCIDAYKVEPWTSFKSIVEIVEGKVKLSKTNAVIEKGKTLTLEATATITPSDLPDENLTWKSSNTEVATVTSAGKVKGVKTGTATITCTSNSTGAKATCKVTVGSVKLDQTKIAVEKNKTKTLTATVYPSSLTDQSVTWKSSNTAVATVTSAGKVKGVKAGTATITCTSNATGLSTTCKVTVGYVKLDKTEMIVEKTKTKTLTATVYPSSLTDQSVTWKSSNTAIATVSNNGKVKGVKTGTATITCTSNATGLRTTCKVTVGSVKLDQTEMIVEKTKTKTLTATVYPSSLTDQSVTWKSSNTAVATVTSAGKVKGVKAGTATITCTSKATGLKATCQVTVGKVVIGTSEITIKKNRSMMLNATVYPSDLTDKRVTWKSSNTSIATVTAEGKVKGIKAGTATITCTSVATGLKGTCTVIVLSNSEARSMIGDDDELTGLKELESPAIPEPFDVYDLSGRKVLHQVTSLDGLPDGIYIVNGKKILKKK
ncbi:MAG: leucine-rich repeat protein [Prevotella sp.]|nr:leucine-rich repeat protein [Prevotella sp.]